MAGMLNFAILNLAMLDSVILVFPFKLPHTCQDWFPPFWTKNFTHSFSLTLKMAAILNSVIFNLSILVFPLKLTNTCQNWFPPFAQKNFTHSFWLNLRWQPFWILSCWIETLPSWIQTPCYLFSDSLKNTLIPVWLWLKLIQSDSNSFILT